MAISGLDQINRMSFQLKNQWEFEIQDADERMKFKIRNANLPFLKLSVENSATGLKYYSGFEPEEGFSMEFMETTDFSTYNYFQSWLDLVFDRKNMVFRSEMKGEAFIHRNATLTLYGFTGRAKVLGAIPIRRGESISQKFLFENLKVLGLDAISFDYESGEPLIYTVNFTVDRVIPQGGDGPGRIDQALNDIRERVSSFSPV